MTTGKRIKWTSEELAWIEARRTWPRKEAHAAFCLEFDRTDVSFYNFKSVCQRRGWKTGRTSRFLPGVVYRVPPNSGRGYKKGNIPHNAKPLGHERIIGHGYVGIKVREGGRNSYVPKHKHLWEQINGPVPKGTVLKCRDGDRLNTDPSNWEAVPRSILTLMNGSTAAGGINFQTAPAELKSSVLMLAKVRHATREKSRRKKP